MNIARKIIKDQSKKLEDYLLGQWVTLENAHLFEIEWITYDIETINNLDNEQFLLFIWQLDLRKAQNLYNQVTWYRKELLSSIIM